MGKTILLVRHSYPENRTGLQRDFDRALTPKGIADTLKMAGFLKKLGIKPDILLASTAKRAAETADILASILEIEQDKVFFERKLYYSTAQTMLEEISCQSDEISCIMVVGHNPGISELSRMLSSGIASYMSNTQVSFINFETDSWSLIDPVNRSVFKNFDVEDLDNI